MPEKNTKILKSNIGELPGLPGIYQFFDDKGCILYVGKAKNLKKRVTSYFKINQANNKIKLLLKKAISIGYFVVENESDALLLENNMIKKHQPRYNVLLKDDKTFPWICIKNENYPRVFMTRTYIKDGSFYYGPYTSARSSKKILELFKQLYKTRTCKYNLNIQNIEKQKFKLCLEYHIGNCFGPCVGNQSEKNYQKSIEEIKKILKGDVVNLIRDLNKRMKKLSEQYKYEEAGELQEKIRILENYKIKSTVVSPDIINADVFSFTEDKISAYINFLKVINGAIIQSDTIEIVKRLDESKEELLCHAITEIRQKLNSTTKEIIIPFKLDYYFDNVKFVVPLRGDKKMLLDLSTKNVFYYRMDKMKQREKADPGKNTRRKLEALKNDLHLKELPVNIECFDNSNIQGKYPVASCVVFVNSRPLKKEYRHFNIKTVEGPDDYASMEEVILRRYERKLKENMPLPQLIVVDGGKGQLGAAVKSLEKIGLRGKIAVIGIAKRLEEIYFPDDSVPLYLDKNSESLRLIQQIRNEAHRFGIKFHRLKRSGDFLKSELEQIKGIGLKSRELLLEEFKTIENIKNTKLADLEKIIKPARAKLVYDYYINTK